MKDSTDGVLGHWIDGAKWLPPGATRQPVFNPSLGSVTRHVALGGSGEVDRAVAVALGAQRAWVATPLVRRARVLARFASLLDTRKTELARIISAEHGKTVSDAEGDVTRGLEVVVITLIGPSRDFPLCRSETRRPRSLCQ